MSWMQCRTIRKALSIPMVLSNYLTASRKHHSNGVAIFMYHGIANYPLDVSNWCLLDVKEFERQAQFISDHYCVLHLQDALTRLNNGKPLPPNAACITFDDGFRSVATRAFPILDRYQLPATVFLVAGFVGSRQPAWPDQLYFNISKTVKNEITFKGNRYQLQSPLEKAVTFTFLVAKLKELPNVECDNAMNQLSSDLGHFKVPEDAEMASLTWDEIKLLLDSKLMTFGSHTLTHPILSNCSLEVQREELENSRNILIEHGLPHQLFAYPNGRAVDFTKKTKRLLYELGYICGLSTISGINRRGEDRYALKRICVGDTTTVPDFESMAIAF